MALCSQREDCPEPTDRNRANMAIVREDTAVAAAKARNLVPDSRNIPVSLDLGRADGGCIGLVGTGSEAATMAAHTPLPAAAWEAAASVRGAIADVDGDPGRIRTAAAAFSANERPVRTTAASAALAASGLAGRCLPLPARPATRTELAAAHGVSHVDAVLALESTSSRRGDEIHDADEGSGCDDGAETLATRLLRFSTASNYVFMNEASVAAARMAAGATVEAALAVARGDVKAAVAVVRPPGHHSEADCAMGFCLFNNVAVATRAVQAETALKRVLVVDWDIHHGNGTQAIFDADPSVLYFSAHMYNTGWEFPMCAPHNTTPGDPTYVGSGAGLGRTVNVGWNNGVHPCPGYGDAEYAATWERLLLPIAREYEPEIVIISAGFDSAAGDECGYFVTPAGYAHLTATLAQLPSVKGRVVVVLEGGYNIPAIETGMEACTATLLGVVEGDPMDSSKFGQCSRHALEDLSATIKAHKPYWRCLGKKE